MLSLRNLLSFVSEDGVNRPRTGSLESISELTVRSYRLRSEEIVEEATWSASSLTLLQGNFRVHRDPTYRLRRCGTSTAADALQMTRY